MPQYTKQKGDTQMTVTSIHLLDMELAKRVGIVSPYDFISHGLRGYTLPDRLPATFRPSLSACDALLVAAEMDMKISFEPDYVEVEWAGDSLRVSHDGARWMKLQAMCTAVMKMASHILEIPL